MMHFYRQQGAGASCAAIYEIRPLCFLYFVPPCDRAACAGSAAREDGCRAIAQWPAACAGSAAREDGRRAIAQWPADCSKLTAED
jgi:hypothetical protein